MMKRLLVCAAAAGVAVGIIYLLRKTKKANGVPPKLMKDAPSVEPENKSEKPIYEQNIVTEMYEEKQRNAQAVYERHTEAAEIMTDAFSNIMKDVEPVEVEKKSVGPVIDTQDVEVVKELDSLSDELDELLK